jgi:hypothetical protein
VPLPACRADALSHHSWSHLSLKQKIIDSSFWE